jgi:hypothetical protein
MRRLQPRHISLFRILRDHCLFLTRRQIERIFTLPTNSANKELLWLVSDKYLNRRHRADTFVHFQTPVYYLGPLGWQMVGKSGDDYKAYRAKVEGRSERGLAHSLSVYDVYLKFILESEVKRIIGSEAVLWQEAIEFGNVPDGWIEFKGGEAFIEVDRGNENHGVLQRKLDNYVRFERSGGYRGLFHDSSFKVLFFTTSEQRIESLERLTESGNIWFCTMEEFLREKLTHEHWFALYGFYALPAAPKEKV